MSEDWDWLEDMAALFLTVVCIVCVVAVAGLLYWWLA